MCIKWYPKTGWLRLIHSKSTISIDFSISVTNFFDSKWIIWIGYTMWTMRLCKKNQITYLISSYIASASEMQAINFILNWNSLFLNHFSGFRIILCKLKKKHENLSQCVSQVNGDLIIKRKKNQPQNVYRTFDSFQFNSRSHTRTHNVNQQNYAMLYFHLLNASHIS